MQKMRQVLTVAIAAMLVGCQVLQPGLPLARTESPARSVVASTVDQGYVRGRADFPASRSAQALPAEVVAGSTVSFFDATGTTLATGKTDLLGNFSLALGGFAPVNGATYFLEASKGLNSNAPGASAARLRTILKWNGTGWLSCTNSDVSGAIVLNALTTALAIESALDATNVPAAQTIGKVNASASPATFNAAPGPYTNHPDAELVQLANDLISSLSGNFDPVASVPAIKPTITGLSPTSGPINALVQISGTGFNPVPSGNSVKINGAAAGVVLATPTNLVVTVGAGAAATGNVSVTTGRGTATGGTFTLTAGGGGTAFWIDGFSPREGRPGTSFTLRGQFGTLGSTPSVSFDGIDGQRAYATVTAFDATSVTAQVPLGALPGRVLVQGNGTTSTSGEPFDVWQGELSAMTAVANPNPQTTSLHQHGDGWGGRYATARYGQYQYVVSWQNVWLFPLLQTGGIGAPRIAGRLGVGRNWASMVIYGRYMYVIGGEYWGACSTIERATINDDGSLTPFKTIGNLQTPRFYGASVVMGSTIYVLPGAWTGSIERWNIDPNTGNITFVASYNQNYFGQAGNTGYYGYSYAQWGNWIYFFGGYYSYNLGHTNLGFAINTTGDGGISTPFPAPSLPIKAYVSSCVMANIGGNNGNTSDVYVLGGYRQDLDSWANPTVWRANWDWRRSGGVGTGYVSDFVQEASLLSNLTPAYVFANGPMIHAVSGTIGNLGFNFMQSSTLSGSTLGAWTPTQGTAIHGASVILLGNKVWTVGGDYQTNDANGNAVNTPSAVTRYVTLNDDGSLGAAGAGPTLNTARGHAPVLEARGHVYVLGGGNWAQGQYSSIERAPIQADGALGTFMTLPQTLGAAKWLHSAVVYKDAIYVFGGVADNGTTSVTGYTTVERFPVNADGNLGARQVLAATLPEPTWGATPVVIGRYVYLIGGNTKNGYNGSNHPGVSSRVLRAEFQSDGSLSQFSDAGTLAQPISYALGALIGNYVYTFGGSYGTFSGVVQRAAVRPDGSLTDWQLYESDSGAPVMPSPLYAEMGAPVIRNNAVYIPNVYDTVSPGRNMSCAFLYGTIR